jgi:hypothetical protein
MPKPCARPGSKLPALPEGGPGAELQARFEALLASLPQPVRKPRDTAQPARRGAMPPSTATRRASRRRAPGSAVAPPGKGPRAPTSLPRHMDALEAALQQGSLAHAAELDKALKDTKGKGMRLTGRNPTAWPTCAPNSSACRTGRAGAAMSRARN